MLVRRRRRSLARLATRLTAWAREPQTDPVTPAENLDASEAAQKAQLALSKLSAAKREAFVLIALEGMSGEEAARVAGVPLRTVFTRLHHARQELRAALEEA
jgi:RNA polymerase sigma-70 factor (ECF subfamily)